MDSTQLGLPGFLAISLLLLCLLHANVSLALEFEEKVDISHDLSDVRHVERRAASSDERPTAHTSGASKATAIPKNDVPVYANSSFDTMLVIALSIAAVLCFIFGIVVAYICLKSMRAVVRETSVAEYPFGMPGKKPLGRLNYSSEEQTQLFNYQQKKAQLRGSQGAQSSPLPSASGEDTTTAEEGDDGRNLQPGESHQTLYVSSGQAPGKLGKIVNPAFNTGKHSARRTSSGYSSRSSGHTPGSASARRTPPSGAPSPQKSYQPTND